MATTLYNRSTVLIKKLSLCDKNNFGTVFSKYIMVMIKKVLLIAVILTSITLNAQRGGQKIGYVDMEYILENIPEYAEAQSQLNQKAIKWQQKLDKIKKEIETMKADLHNEKALLTEDLINEKLEDIAVREDDFKKLEAAYFSSNGDLFHYRKMLVKPIQDKVFNAAQEIGKARGYDIIFDKSSDVIMIYTNKKADISELVLKSITRAEKTANAKEKRDARNKEAAAPKVLSEEAQKKLDEREAKKQAALDKVAQQKADRLKKREAQKAEIERKRLERQKKREEVRNKLKENKENNNDEKKNEND